MIKFNLLCILVYVISYIIEGQKLNTYALSSSPLDCSVESDSESEKLRSGNFRPHASAFFFNSSNLTNLMAFASFCYLIKE